ncbi:TetR/AcrR family transcriptional regulator [Rhodoferax aquaticus]|uniref:TetR/AcrR family transcriptional regulator n=1 Tax=Rhodoferax aquaticus TaxID=2527691 RepID=A0A515ESB1_9BURK|nr:TetR/AcrR family transcriptional regulator [Rhodoferax aquaticus]QDL55567.1 TetR/AcrR family transcriptional regulator [Rhodoferax aquaticus]
MATDTPTDPNPKPQAILDAAERLFVRYGYRKSSMDDVAREAGIAKGTVYLYYAGKEALFRALLERIGEAVISASHAAAQAEQPFSERLFGVLDAMYGYFHERFSDSGHLQELGEIRGSLGQDLSEQLRQRHLQILLELIERAEAQGDVALAARGLLPGDIATLLIAASLGAKTMVPANAGTNAYTESLRNCTRVMCAAVAPVGPA